MRGSESGQSGRQTEAGGYASDELLHFCAIKQKYLQQREVREVAAPIKSNGNIKQMNDDGGGGGVSGAVMGPASSE